MQITISENDSGKLNFTSNMVLLNYNAVTIDAFKSHFEDLLKLESFKDLNFEIDDDAIRYEDPRLKDQLPSELVPLIAFRDSKNNLVIQYIQMQNKLQIANLDATNSEKFKAILIDIIGEQANKLTAIGFNWSRRYEEGNSPIVSSANTTLCSTSLKDKTINSTDFVFAYNEVAGKEDTYRKSYKITFSDDVTVITANYHYDRFATITSKAQIAREVIRQVSEHYDTFLAEFTRISDEIMGK